FLAAAEKVGLEEVLSNDELTAFVPNNAAFTSFLLAIDNFNSLDDFDTEDELLILKDLVEYHLVAQIILSGDLINGPLSTVEGGVITVEDGTLLSSISH